MTNSTIIARLMGPVLLFMGISAVIGLLIGLDAKHESPVP
jgi:hypothetical protein